MGLDVVTFIPAGAPWQKAGRRVSSAADRWAMTELAVAGVDYFEADDREVRRDGWTYTIDTLESFDDDVVLVVGADAACGLPTWHRFEAVCARAEIAVVPRPGVENESVAAALEGARWRLLAGPSIDISGTALRTFVAAGTSIRFLVPEPVRRYIIEHGLYVDE